MFVCTRFNNNYYTFFPGIHNCKENFNVYQKKHPLNAPTGSNMLSENVLRLKIEARFLVEMSFRQKNKMKMYNTVYARLKNVRILIILQIITISN